MPYIARTGTVAALFALAVMGALVVSYLASDRADPLNAAELTALKEQLAKEPKNEALKQRIRVVDAELRTRYFAQVGFTQRGTYLLLAGVALALAALKFAGTLREQPLDPRGLPVPDTWRMAAHGRWGTAALGLVLAGGLVALVADSRRATVFRVAAPPSGDGGTGGAADYPSAEEWARNWPVFRGPHYSGLAETDRAPAQWDGPTGANIRWKTPVPLAGASSPVVWQDRVFVTGATANRRQVYAFDVQSGQLLWQQEVKDPATANAKPPKVFQEMILAACTPATDGRRVYAMFANADVAALSVEGKLVWVKNLGAPESQYGFSASLALWHDRLIIQLDSGAEGKSALIALEAATGKVAWRTSRPVPDSWSSPAIFQTGTREELITCGRPTVIAYNPASGEELWRADCLDGDVAPSPAFGGGLVFVCNDRAKLSALRPGGSGDVTKTHVAWSADEGMPDTVSPLADADLVYLIDSNGNLTCYDARDGKKIWDHAFEVNFQASPILAARRIYLVDGKGVTHILALGREFKELGQAPLGEAVMATPAFVGNRIFIRGEKHLYGIGSKE